VGEPKVERRLGLAGLPVVAVAVVGVLVLALNRGEVSSTLTINTPGGAVQKALRLALLDPASKKLGLRLKEETSDNALDALRLEVAARAVTTDIMVMSAYQAAIASDEGDLEPIDYHVVDTKDFLPGSAPRYCVGIYGYAAVLGWNTHTYPKVAPTSWADFWNVGAFPGKRAMRADAEAQVEMALLADGVSPAELYSVLSTEAGMKRAIDKIRELKPSIAVWWSSGAQAGQLMKDGEVDISSGWNARFQSAKDAGGPVDYTYNQGILTFDCFAVTKGSRHKQEAMKLINEMSTAASQAHLANLVSEGPLNAAAYRTGLISPERAATLPTSPVVTSKVVVQDIDWWTRNNNRVQQMFENMMTE
jgi:putative spermidine/putrescine transport system substrate-binding protein